MTLKLYTWGMKISTILSFIALGLVIYYIDPEQSALASQGLFYLSIFLAVTGLVTLFFTSLRKKGAGSKLSQQEASLYIVTNFRQGALVALLVVILLVFQSVRILTWWDGLLVVAGIFIIELYFLSNVKKYK